MWMGMFALSYIDPNTSQHLFSLLGPILAFLTAAGGMAVAALVFVRHQIASYFRKASWAQRLAVTLALVGGLTIGMFVLWSLLR